MDPKLSLGSHVADPQALTSAFHPFLRYDTTAACDRLRADEKAPGEGVKADGAPSTSLVPWRLISSDGDCA